MNKLRVKDILKVTNGMLLCGNEEEECINFCKDTRTIEKDDIYVGFNGEKFDGSAFYREALLKGAKGCIINEFENIEKVEDKFIIVVKDTVQAIGKIAELKRSMYDIPVVAITGSVGKTSTKDMIYSVVSQKFKTLKTQGNMNNEIGLPFTILGLKDEEALVVEMGMNHFGELSRLTNIAKPSIAVITNVGTAHIGNLGSRENILKAKLEILEGLQEKGRVVINNDNDLLHRWNGEQNKYKVETFGIKNKSKNMAENIQYRENGSSYIFENEEIEVPVGGEAFVYNSLAAISVGKILKIDIEKIKRGIETFELSKMRLDVIKSKNGYTIINDCYNANYDSMKSALEYLGKIADKRKIAVLGDMLELGEFSNTLHEKVGEEVIKNNVDVLITVGKEARNIANVAKNKKIEIYEFESNQDAISKLKKIIKKEDTILVKASNSMNFKEIVNAFKDMEA